MPAHMANPVPSWRARAPRDGEAHDEDSWARRRAGTHAMGAGGGASRDQASGNASRGTKQRTCGLMCLMGV